MSGINYRELRAKEQNVQKEGQGAKIFFPSYLPSRLALQEEQEPPPQAKVAEAPQEVEAPLSEKAQVLKSFESYVEESGSQTEQGQQVTFSGGQVTKQVEESTSVEIPNDSFMIDEEVIFVDQAQASEVKVLFVCEKPQDVSDESGGQDILSKMISAMQLQQGSFQRVFIKKEGEQVARVWQEVLKKYFVHDKITVVSMGAFTTNTICGKKDRLSKIHGKELSKLYHYEDKQLEVTIFPVFHPDLLLINPNMKRSAWIDLQKVMKFLNQD